MRSFATPEEAAAYLAPLLDQPVERSQRELGKGALFQAEPIFFGETFTNAYTLRWRPPVRASVIVAEPPISAVEFARKNQSIATTTGGFFFLADRCLYRPKTLSLNLAVQNGKALSVPVSSQEALVSQGGALFVTDVAASGALSLNRERLLWAGSKTSIEADCHTYGNANCIILHQPDATTGKVRTFQEESRLTPEIKGARLCDLGFVAQPEGYFQATHRSDQGRLDIFQYDLVLRCPRSLAKEGARLEVHTIGPLTLERSLQGAISVGPSLLHPDPYNHPLNDDRSLGSFPLLRERPAARLVFYETSDGWRHLSLFDGRPGSKTFLGVTLAEAASLVASRGEVISGCFLDSGNTSKLNIRQERELSSFGNRHYLRWPEAPGGRFIWNPDQGRATASLLALE